MYMKPIHVKRAALWSKQLSSTLIKFWVAHPQETPAVIIFLWQKTKIFPMFLSRNVKTEEYTHTFEESLEHVRRLYKTHGKDFNPKDPKSCKKFEKILQDRYQFLYFLVRKTKPDVVVETGVGAGQSTGYILQAISENKKGKLYSLDLPFQWYVYGNHELHLDSLPAGQMPGYLVPERLRKNWKLTLGDTYKKLPGLLDKIKDIDIFIHDSEHSYKAMLFEYNEAWPHIKKNGFLLSDDVHFTKSFDEFSKLHKLKPINFIGMGVLRKANPLKPKKRSK
jgi:hypothetical protein